MAMVISIPMLSPQMHDLFYCTTDIIDTTTFGNDMYMLHLTGSVDQGYIIASDFYQAHFVCASNLTLGDQSLG